MDNKDAPLKPDDFPLETDKEKLFTQKAKHVASGTSEKVAENIAHRLNVQADQEEEDRWA